MKTKCGPFWYPFKVGLFGMGLSGIWAFLTRYQRESRTYTNAIFQLRTFPYRKKSTPSQKSILMTRNTTRYNIIGDLGSRADRRKERDINDVNNVHIATYQV